MDYVPAAPGVDREALLERYRHLVRYVVRRLGASVPGVFDQDDAMQAGMLGVLAAAEAYRPDRGASFETYAILRIRGSILDAVRSLDHVRRSRPCAAVTVLSLNVLGGGDGEQRRELSETLIDQNAIDPVNMAEWREELAGLVAEVGQLGHRNQRVIAMYYRDELTFREIASVLGVSESRACQIHSSALKSLFQRLTQLGAVVRPTLAVG